MLYFLFIEPMIMSSFCLTITIKPVTLTIIPARCSIFETLIPCSLPRPSARSTIRHGSGSVLVRSIPTQPVRLVGQIR